MKSHLKLVPLALAFSLFGCATIPNLASLDLKSLNLGSIGSSLNLTSGQKTLMTQYVQDLAAQVQTQTDQTTSEVLSSDEYSVMSYSVMGGPKINRAEKVRQFEQNMKNKLKGKLDRKKQGMQIVKTEADNDLGGKDYTVVMTKESPNLKMVREVIKSYNADKDLVKVSVKHSADHKNGLKSESTRIKIINEDGSYTVTSHSVMTRKDGKSKIVDWTRTGTADGVETGTGLITRFDGATISINVSRTAEGVASASVEAPEATVEASQGEDSDTLNVEVSADGQTDSQQVSVPEEGAIAPSEE